jgi:hypothetical protein
MTPPRIGQRLSFNDQTDEFNVLRYGEAVDDLLDRINEGAEVIVTSDGAIEYDMEPKPGTYRLVPWDLLREAKT